ncbi:MAG: hypothetical protein ABI723_06125 [Bacteroidia bacterium]
MGLYNYWEDKLPEPLNSQKCAICDHSMNPINEDPSVDAFQYKCKNCNPKVIIEISGSLLADDLYDEMRRDASYRKELKSEIGKTNERNFRITSFTVGKRFLHLE